MFFETDDRGIDFSVCAEYIMRVKCARSTFGDFHFTARHY